MARFDGSLFSSDAARRYIPVEIGCSEKTGVALPGAKPSSEDESGIEVVALSAESAASIGSDFARCGPVFPSSPSLIRAANEQCGGKWIISGRSPCLAEQALAGATAEEIRLYPHPASPDHLQVVERRETATILDPAMPGIVEICFSLRGGWSFLELCVEKSPIALALLDWAQRALVERYAFLLETLPLAPSLVLYRDEWGSDVAAYFSAREFDSLIWPRLKALFSEIRARVDAPIAVQIRGATKPLLKHLVDEGVVVVGIDCNARGMVAADLRRDLGRDVILHGTADIWALGNCLSTGDLRGTAVLVSELAAAMPTIAAPAAPLSDQVAFKNAACAAAFLGNLSEGDFEQLSRFGPVRDIIERAARDVSGEFIFAPPPTLHVRHSSHVAESDSSGRDTNPENSKIVAHVESQTPNATGKPAPEQRNIRVV